MNLLKLSVLYASVLLFGNFLSCSSINKKNSKGNHEFVEIFDGKTLKNWKGDPKYWSVQNGSLVGTVTPETLLKNNTFIIWQGGQPENFELKLEYRISELGNSGVNYRSMLMENKLFALRGYQCDIDGKQKYTGQNYEEKKRTTLAYRGEKVIVDTQDNPSKSGGLRSNIKKNCWQTRNVVKQLGNKEDLKANIKKGRWNKIHLIIDGNSLKHYVNGVLMSEVIDNDTINRKMNGFIGVQVHTGPPMQVEYRKIKIKKNL
ncbi:DUF1080 domain-containing protein [Bacteroidota bacterium]